MAFFYSQSYGLYKSVQSKTFSTNVSSDLAMIGSLLDVEILSQTYTQCICLVRVWELEASLSKTKLAGQFWLLNLFLYFFKVSIAKTQNEVIFCILRNELILSSFNLPSSFCLSLKHIMYTVYSYYMVTTLYLMQQGRIFWRVQGASASQEKFESGMCTVYRLYIKKISLKRLRITV